MIKAVIFDFDGVLADSFESLYRLNAFAFHRLGLPLNEANYRDLFNGNIHKKLKLLIGDERALKKCVDIKKKHFGKFYGNVRLYPFSAILVRTLSNKFSLAIVSSTHALFIKELLEKVHLEGYFRVILGSSAESKADELRKAMSAMSSSPEETVFITDTAGDLRIGKQLGVETLAASWGFHNEENLRNVKPAHVFNNHRDLIKYLNSY